MENEFEPIKSSNLVGARYNADLQTCEVKFKNGTYRYFDVSPDVYAAFRETFQSDVSSGGHLRGMVKGLKYEKLS